MKATKFLTLILTVNLSNAIARNWTPASRIMVILNAFAVLAMIAVQVLFGKDES